MQSFNFHFMILAIYFLSVFVIFVACIFISYRQSLADDKKASQEANKRQEKFEAELKRIKKIRFFNP